MNIQLAAERRQQLNKKSRLHCDVQGGAITSLLPNVTENWVDYSEYERQQLKNYRNQGFSSRVYCFCLSAESGLVSLWICWFLLKELGA